MWYVNTLIMQDISYGEVLPAAGREELLREWFDMWLAGEDRGIARIFADDALYVESWGPYYRGAAEIAHWFREWNTRGRVVRWNAGRFFHSGCWSVVEWSFRCEMHDGAVQEFDGVSVVGWDADGRIASLKEYGCNTDNYDPYADSPSPQFRADKVLWF